MFETRALLGKLNWKYVIYVLPILLGENVIRKIHDILYRRIEEISDILHVSYS